MNEAEKRVKILEVFHETVRLSLLFLVGSLGFLSLAFPCSYFARRFDTDERTERLLYGSFGVNTD